MQTSKLYALGATRIVVGLSAITTVPPSAYQGAGLFRILSGGGTLEIVPVPVATSGSSAIGWGIGYPLALNQEYFFGGPAEFYLAATGATMTLAMMPGYSSGISLI